MSSAVVLGIWAGGLLGLLSASSQVDIAPPRKQLLTSVERPLQIRPKTIREGEIAVLSWFNKNTSEVLVFEYTEVDGLQSARCRLIGRFPSKGSLDVAPRFTTTYVVTCADTGTSCAESISLKCMRK